jgi:hypothetical protein
MDSYQANDSTISGRVITRVEHAGFYWKDKITERKVYTSFPINSRRNNVNERMDVPGIIIPNEPDTMGVRIVSSALLDMIVGSNHRMVKLPNCLFLKQPQN